MAIAQGRLHDAMRTYERGLELAADQGGVTLRGAADMHVGISEILRQCDDLADATRHLQLATDLGEANGLPQNPYRSRVAAAGIRQAEGDPEAALQLLAEADRLYATDYSPEVRPVGALKARVWIATGRLSEARSWARERGLSAEDELDYVREFEHITLARLILAQGARDRSDDRIGEAIGLLERLLVAAEGGGRTGSVIEILVVQALARRARNDVPGALALLERAVALAEPEGYVRVVADEGPTMAALLRLAAQRRKASSYLPPAPGRNRHARRAHARGSTTDRASVNGSSTSCGSWRASSTARTSRAELTVSFGNRADPHQERLRQARREQPTSRRPPGRRARPALAHPRPPTRRVVVESLVLV